MKPHTSYAQQVDRGDRPPRSGTSATRVESLEGRLDALATREREGAARCCGELRNIDRRSPRSSASGWTSSRAASSELSRRAGRRRAPPARRGRRRPAASTASRGPTAYNDAHRRFVARELDDAELLERFRAGAELPPGLGHGLRRARRRVPLARRPAARPGAVLDAGSTLNHLHVLPAAAPAHRRPPHRHARARGARRSRSSASPTSTPTCASCRWPTPPTTAWSRSRRSSTSGWTRATSAAATEVADDPQRELLAAVGELRRVLRPAATATSPCPTGRGERFEWVRSLTPEELDEIVAAFAPARVVDRLLPLCGRWVAALGSRGRGRRLLPRPLLERRCRPRRPRSRRGGRLPAPGPGGLTALRAPSSSSPPPTPPGSSAASPRWRGWRTSPRSRRSSCSTAPTSRCARRLRARAA